MRRILVLGALAAAAVAIILIGRTTAQAAEPVSTAASRLPDSTCRSCHDQKNLSLQLAGGDELSVTVTPKTLASSVHASLQCTNCHQPESASFPHAPVSATNIRQYQIAEDKVCRTCHLRQASEIKNSIHGQSDPNDAGLCIDCHGAHNVQNPQAANYRVASVSVCTSCHQDNALMVKYGVSTKVVSTYFQDFHGKTEYLVKQGPGDEPLAQAVCSDCHGAHNIQNVNSASSMVIKDNLTATCARCHAGASANFPAAWLSHKEPSITESPLVFLVRWFYRLMIPFIIVGLLVHIVVDILASKRRKGEQHVIS